MFTWKSFDRKHKLFLADARFVFSVHTAFRSLRFQNVSTWDKVFELKTSSCAFLPLCVRKEKSAFSVENIPRLNVA